MKSRWNEKEARAACRFWKTRGIARDLALRTYSARLIGADPALVLHGGGNTSVKSKAHDLRGEELEVLHIKGSGWDLRSIEPSGHPAVRLDRLLTLRGLDALSDEEMVNQCRINLLDASSPNPSVEALLHAFLPHTFIDHTHADAVLSIVNQPRARDIVREVYGDSVGIVRYVMAGFELSTVAARVYERSPDVVGLILIHHGIFTFGATARESYERMIQLVSQAERFIRRARGKTRSRARVRKAPPSAFTDVAPTLRGRLAIATGSSQDSWKRFILHFRTTPAIRSFLARPDLRKIALLGPPTPDHVLRTKRLPLILLPGADPAKAIATYGRACHEAFVKHCTKRRVDKAELDGSPRVILLPGSGIVGVGVDMKAARIAADLYEHAIDIITDAETAGSYRPLDALNLFDIEYWSLEQAKLGKAARKPLDGAVTIVTGAGSGIGAETARVFAEAGAHLALWDVDVHSLAEAAGTMGDEARVRTDVVDVTDRTAVNRAVSRTVAHYGGLDIVVSNAGRAWIARMDECSDEDFRQSLDLNLAAHQHVAAAASHVLKAQNTGGALLFNASKSAFNPGPELGPYTIAKAGVIALMKQYAVEGGPFGIRAGAVNADRIQTRLFENGVLEQRARARGITVDEYLRGNLLGREVTARDVGEAFLCLALAYKTTAAVFPVDGGNIAAAPR